MFSYLYEWMLNLAGYLVLVTAAMHMIPDGSYQKYIRFFSGIVLILLILTPVFRLFGTEMPDIRAMMEEYEKQIQKIELEEAGEDVVQVDEIEIGW